LTFKISLYTKGLLAIFQHLARSIRSHLEIKNTLRSSAREVRNLVEFSRSIKRKVKMFLFYPGEEYVSIKKVQVIPIAGLYRGQ
jgi:hypothetical protein